MTDMLRLLIEALPEGAVLTDARAADMPVVYVNPAFERMTGYPASELVGRNLRMLQGEHRNQAGLRRLQDAIKAGLDTRALLQNQRKNGDSFWMEVHMVPVRDASGTITHWASLHRETEARGTIDARSAGGHRIMASGLLHREDPLTGLKSRETFDELLEHDFGLAHRDQLPLTLFVAGVDDLGGYNDTFGKAAGDALLKRVARALGTCFRRSSDVLGRWEGGMFVALASGMDEAQMRAHAETVCARVRDLRVHHPRSRYGRYVTISVGVAGGIPPAEARLQHLLDTAFAAVSEAQATGDTACVRRLQGTT
jgi:diguanylate cyclase (GGDEF)-like protein/PAS domain S-box-containing protein